MPADADLLCEFYLSSQLSTSKSVVQQQQRLQPSSQTSSSSSATSSFVSDTIDFVKYTQKSMSDGLKRKYELLVATSSSSSNHSSPQKPTPVPAPPPPPPAASPIQTTKQSQTNQVVAVAKSAPSLDLTWSRIRKTGIGLLNLGNNCYLNATIQCLAYTPPLSQWLVTRPHSPACRFRLVKGFCSLCEVERLIFDIFNSTSGAYSCAKPNNLCYNIKKISNLFGVGTQEDASEFLTTLLENMAKAIKFSQPQPSMVHANGGGGKKSSSLKSHTIFDEIFSFQFRSRITCSSCGRLSDTIEDTNIWPLEVKYVQDIRKGMLHFLKEEILDGENAYKCEKCGRKTRATKKYSIRSAPNILVIHLKRFDSSYAGKLSHYVAYPETLSLPELSPPGSAHYRLYGVLVHLGYTSHSGHYFAYVRGPSGQHWFKADDTSVSAVSPSDALAQNAYILFYARVTDEHNSAAPVPVPKPIVATTNGFKSPANGQNNIPNHCSNNGVASSMVKSSPTSSYLNGILVAKRPVGSPVFVPRVIKVEEMGPSPAKVPRLEYGPQLPPSVNGNGQQSGGTDLKPKAESTNGNSLNGHASKESKSDDEASVKTKSKSKKLRRKKLKKLLKQIRQGRIKPDELSEKQLRLAKTKKEKKRLKKVLKKRADSKSGSS